MTVLSVVVIFTGCVTQGADKPESVEAAPPAADVASAQTAPAEAPPTQADTLVYSDSLTFDLRLSQALRNSDNSYVLATPEGVNLNAIPDDLDKWLSRIRDEGGSVKAAALDENGQRTRAWFGALIDVILFFVGLAKDEIVFSAVDDFDAVMFYDEATGDVKEIVFTRRQNS